LDAASEGEERFPTAGKGNSIIVNAVVDIYLNISDTGKEKRDEKNY